MAQQTYYEALGLSEPPKDRRAVKKAYSALLKKTRPEDDPEGFMQLRDAHDLALHILSIEAQDRERDAAQNAPSLDYATLVEDASEQDDAQPIHVRVADIPPAFAAKNDDADRDTAYSIGPTPSLDAPVPERAAPPPPPLLDDLNTILTSPPRRNDRESWNQLFRDARQLGIDDYVDFEHMLLETMLERQGFYDHSNDQFDTPEKMEKLFSPSITASLFRTMNWDKVSKFDRRKTYQIEWLERRMGASRPTQNTSYGPPDVSGPENKMNWVWPVLFTLFIVAKIAQYLANS